MEVLGFTLRTEAVLHILTAEMIKSSEIEGERKPAIWMERGAFPTGRGGMRKIKAGRWRDDSTGPMQVISGPEHRENILEQTQRGGLDIILWMDWFLGCLGRAIDGAQTMLKSVLTKDAFGRLSPPYLGTIASARW